MGCHKMFPDSKSWSAPCALLRPWVMPRAQQAQEEGMCAGGRGRTTGSIPLSLCLADNSPPSLVPACPTPVLRYWTAAISQHQALGTEP